MEVCMSSAQVIALIAGITCLQMKLHTILTCQAWKLIEISTKIYKLTFSKLLVTVYKYGKTFVFGEYHSMEHDLETRIFILGTIETMRVKLNDTRK